MGHLPVKKTAQVPLFTLFTYCGIYCVLCDVFRDLVPFVQFKKGQKHPWRSATFGKVPDVWSATFLKVTLLHRCFSLFLNSANGTKSHKTSHHLKSYCRLFTCVTNRAVHIEVFSSLTTDVFICSKKLYFSKRKCRNNLVWQS